MNAIKFRGRIMDLNGNIGEETDIIGCGYQWIAAWGGDKLLRGDESLADVPLYQVFGVDRKSTFAAFEKFEEKTGYWYGFSVAANEPFAVVSEEYDSVGRKEVSFAYQYAEHKQIKLFVRHPKFVRGASGWRWVKLQKLAEFMGLNSEQLWQFYLPFNNREANEVEGLSKNRTNIFLDIAVDDPSDECFVRAASLNIARSVSLDRIWVPAGWAMFVLRLRALGLRP